MNTNPASSVSKIIASSYQPDLKERILTPEERNKIKAVHFFDHFNPYDNFYLQTNFLAEKINKWFELHCRYSQNREWNDKAFQDAADSFLQTIEPLAKIMENEDNNTTLSRNFIVNHILSRAEKENFDDALVYLYEKYAQGRSWKKLVEVSLKIRYKAKILKCIQVNSIAPDFNLGIRKNTMHHLTADYILLFFWNSTCWQSKTILPQIKRIEEEFNQRHNKKRKLLTISISTDTSRAAWTESIQSQEFIGWSNISECLGIKGRIPMMYNISDTPSLFLLNEEKRIIAKPTTPGQLSILLNDL